MRPYLVFFACCLSVGCSSMTEVNQAPDYVDTTVHRGSYAMDFDSRGPLLATGGWEGELALWSLPDGKLERVWTGHTSSVRGVGFSGHGLVSGSEDGGLTLWTRLGNPVEKVFSGGTITEVAVGGNWAVTGHTDGKVRVWRLPHLHLHESHVLFPGEVFALAVHPTTGRIAASGEGGNAYVWYPDEKPQALQTPANWAHSLEFSPGGEELFGGAWYRVSRWDLASGTYTELETEHWGKIVGLEYVKSRNVLASISRSQDSAVHFLSPASGETTRKFRRQRLCGGAVTVSADGRYMAATGDDGAIRIWLLDGSADGMERTADANFSFGG